MHTKFGTAGNSNTYLTTVSKLSVEAPRWLASVGLDAYEYQCGRGVHIKEENARKLGAEAAAYGISLSLHAPYFINLANPLPESFRKNVGYILDSCRAADFMGATRIVIHSGSLMGRKRSEALDSAMDCLRRILKIQDAEGFGHIALCPETMGKINQLGDLSEVLALCTVDERLVPCIDFGHLYARSLGGLTERKQFYAIFDEMERLVGSGRTTSFHCHFSKIEYTAKGGELRHLNFEDPNFGPEFEPLGQIIAERGYCPTIICESAGAQSEDALAMKRILADCEKSLLPSL